MIAKRGERRRVLTNLRRQKMRWRQVAQKVEPENGKLGQDLALVRDAGGKNVVECRDAVGSDNQKLLANAINIAHFAVGVKFDARKISR